MSLRSQFPPLRLVCIYDGQHDDLIGKLNNINDYNSNQNNVVSLTNISYQKKNPTKKNSVNSLKNHININMKSEEKVNTNNESSNRDNQNIVSIYINMTNKNLHSSKQKIMSLKKLSILRNKTKNSVESINN